MKRIAALIAIFSSFLLAGGAAAQAKDDIVGEDKVIYHLNDGLEQATDGIRNIRNHLSVNPKAKIVVVSHSKGVDFMMKGAKDANGNPYEVAVQDLRAQGVDFQVCEITLQRRKLTRSQFIEESTFVPSGVAQIARLQQRQGYAYLRP